MRWLLKAGEARKKWNAKQSAVEKIKASIR